MIKISSQACVSELGKRENNEDYCAYIEGSTYVLCDGVGGHDCGEIASETTAKCFIDEYKKNQHSDANDVLKIAEKKLSEHSHTDPKYSRMGTTLTLSQITDNGIYIAWVGDSRIYQFRRGEIIFKTVDHSWVNEALKAGIITQEESTNHPKSNIITRAVQGCDKPTFADTKLLQNVKKGDLFLHCSDGVLESWDENDLCALFNTEDNPKIILNKIKEECSQNSKDNFTAIVYKIEESDIKISVDAIPIKNDEFVKNDSTSKMLQILNVKTFGIRLYLLLIIIIPLIILLCICRVNIGNKDIPPLKKEKIEKQDDSKRVNNTNKKEETKVMERKN